MKCTSGNRTLDEDARHHDGGGSRGGHQQVFARRAPLQVMVEEMVDEARREVEADDEQRAGEQAIEEE